MRGAQDALAKFRIEQSLLAAAKAKARREGVTFSELARDALRQVTEAAPI